MNKLQCIGFCLSTSAPASVDIHIESVPSVPAEPEPVYVTSTGHRYHRPGCRHLRGCHPAELPEPEARLRGCQPCKSCISQN